MTTPEKNTEEPVRKVRPNIDRESPHRLFDAVGADQPGVDDHDKNTNGFEDPYQIDPELMAQGEKAAQAANPQMHAQGEEAVLDAYRVLAEAYKAQTAHAAGAPGFGPGPTPQLPPGLAELASLFGGNLSSDLVSRYVQWWIDYLAGTTHATKSFFVGPHGGHHPHAWPHHPGAPHLNQHHPWPRQPDWTHNPYPGNGWCPPYQMGPGYCPPGTPPAGFPPGFGGFPFGGSPWSGGFGAPPPGGPPPGGPEYNHPPNNAGPHAGHQHGGVDAAAGGAPPPWAAAGAMAGWPPHGPAATSAGARLEIQLEANRPIVISPQWINGIPDCAVSIQAPVSVHDQSPAQGLLVALDYDGANRCQRLSVKLDANCVAGVYHSLVSSPDNATPYGSVMYSVNNS